MTLRIFILCILAGPAFGAGSDVYIQGRNAANTAPIQTTVAPAANSLLGFSNTKVPVDVTLGAGMTLIGNVLDSVSGGSGTVTSVSVVTANGIAGSVATATTTPAITLTLGAITPTTVDGLTVTTSTGTLTITNAKVFSVTDNITLSSDGTGTRTLNVGAGGTLGSNAFTSTAYVPTYRTVNGHALSSDVTVTASDVSLGSVTNDTQTKAAIVPNTAPSASQLLVGNAGGTAYAPVSLSGPVSITSAGVSSVSTLNQNTTGSAASLSVSGQTGLVTVTGLASTSRVKTVRDAADTLLELGGSYTPTGTWTNMTLVTPALGTPSALVLTNATGLPAAAMPALTGDVTTSAGAVATTLATVNSNVGTFGSATATATVTLNAKGLATAGSNTTVTPAIGSITGLGTGVATAAAVNVGSAGAVVTNGGALGTPSSGTLDNTTVATGSAGANSTTPASKAYADRAAWTMPPNAQTASFTFVIGDQFRVTSISNASANTATIPPNSSVAFPAGTTLILYNIGAGQCTWTAGSGVTLQSRSSAFKTAGQWGPSYAWQTATLDTWVISGDVTP